jgi:prolyl-tRNA synthetase
MFDKARNFRDQNTRDATSYDELQKILAEQGGFVRAFFKPDRAAEAKMKEQTKATVRLILPDEPPQTGKCIYSGETVNTRVLFAQAY